MRAGLGKLRNSPLGHMLERVLDFDIHMRDVVHGASSALILRLVGMGTSFLLNFVLARILSTTEVGVFFEVILTIDAISQLLRIGLDNAMLRFIAGGAAKDNWEEIAGVYRQGISTVIAIGAVLSLFLWFGGNRLASFLYSEPSTGPILQIAALALLPNALFDLHGDLIRALKKIPQSVFIQVVGMPLFSLIIFLPVHAWLGETAAIWAYVAANYLVLFLALIVWRRFTPSIRNLWGSFSISLLFATSLPMFVMTLGDLFTKSIDSLMVAYWFPAGDVAIYGIAKRVAFITALVLSSVNTIAAPKFAELYSKNDMRNLRKLAQNAARLTGITAVPILLGFIIFAKPLLSIFGSDYANGSTVLIIIAIGQFINMATGSCGFLLIMCGQEKIVRNNAIFFAFFDFIAIAVLIHPFGLLGAAIGSTLAISLNNIGLVIWSYTRLSVITIPVPDRFLPREVDPPA